MGRMGASMETPDAVLANYASRLAAPASSEGRPGVYIEEAVARHGVGDLVATVVRATGSLDPASTHASWLFIRDASVHGTVSREISDAFRDELPRSGFFDALERCLDAPVFAVRSEAARTFGKLGFPENVGRLARALEARRDNDPFLLPGLLFESRWLEGEWNAHWMRARNVIASPEELSRWASLEVIGDCHEEEATATALELARGLENDSSKLIRTEALYVSARLADSTRRARRGNVSKQEWARTGRELEQQERRRIAALKPAWTFSGVMQRFTAAAPTPDYRLDEVASFLDTVR